MRPLLELSSDDDDAVAEALGQVAAKRFSDCRHEQSKPDEVGEESRREQQRPGDDDHRTVSQFTARKAALEQRATGSGQLASTLPAHQRGTENGGRHDDHEGPEDSDTTPNRDEQTDLDDRCDNERQEQPGGESHVGRLQRPVISTAVELRNLPSVDDLARRLADRLRTTGEDTVPAGLLTEIARSAVDEARASLLDGAPADPEDIAWSATRRLVLERPRRIVNATGVLLHTNLGRAPVAQSAVARGAEVSAGYSNLEFDLATGSRGGRGAYVASLLRRLTGAEAALVVNNNAGALLLALAAIAGGGEAVVSRGELIEIGGSFRLPLLMEASGARLIEVGTTNRTRRTDYEAVASRAAAILKVHPSNYRIEGFTDEVDYGTLATVADGAGIPLIADLGSGLLDARTPWLEGPPPTWLSGEPAVRQTLEAGADVVLFSGDKLLGGPQAGIAVGSAESIQRMRTHPVARAVRIDSASLAMLGATLEMYAAGDASDIPFWRMASLGWDELDRRHRRVLDESGLVGAVVDGASTPGAGSVPGELIPSPVLELSGAPETLWRSLVERTVPIVGHRRSGALQLDLRTVDPADDGLVVEALRTIG